MPVSKNVSYFLFVNHLENTKTWHLRIFMSIQSYPLNLMRDKVVIVEIEYDW